MVAAGAQERPSRERPTFLSALNLDFELPSIAPWRAMGDAQRDETAPHGGRASLRVGTHSRAFVALPPAGVRARRVNVTAWMRTEDVVGDAAIFVVVWGTDGALGEARTPPRAGTTSWGHHALGLDISSDATRVIVGAQLAGEGRMWVDDVDITLADPIGKARLSGTVRGPDGRGAGGAVVTVTAEGAGAPVAIVDADAGGGFALEVDPGRYVVTATSEGRSVAAPPAAPAAPLALTVAEQSMSVRGVARGATIPPGARLFLSGGGVVFGFDLAADGRFAVTVPERTYWGYVVGDGLACRGFYAERASPAVDLPVVGFDPAPAELVASIKRIAVPLASIEPGSGTADLRGIASLFARARVVGLGAFVQGAREPVRVAHRLVEHLVADRGFNVVAIDLSWTSARRLDDYVVGGVPPGEDLTGPGADVWRAPELVEAIAWIMRWNQSHPKKVRVVGLELASAAELGKRLGAFLDTLAPDAAAEARALGAAATAAGDGATRPRGGDLVARFDRERSRWIAAAGAPAWRQARRDAVELDAALAAPGARATAAHGRHQVDTVQWLLEDPGARVVIWAHAADVAAATPDALNLGSALRGRLGDRYRPIALLFDHGRFRAHDAFRPPFHLRTFAVGAAHAGDVTEPFTRTGLALFAVDLRRLPAASWLAALRPYRVLGWGFYGETNMGIVDLARAFDGAVFMDQVTPLTERTAK